MRKYLLVFILNLAAHGVFSKGRFYENNIEFEYGCSVKFEYPRLFECACISGLWKFSASSCMDFTFIAGENQYCFENGKIEIARAEQLLEDKEELVIQEQNGDLIRLEKSLYSGGVKLSSNDLLITGTKWEMEDDTGSKFCLNTRPQSYCFFTADALALTSITKIRQGCEGTFMLMEPNQCIKINKENKNTCQHHRVKRAANATAPAAAGAANPNDTLLYDEDYVNATSGNGTTLGTNEAMASELWNFIEGKLDIILELKEPFESEDMDLEALEEEKEHRTKRESKNNFPKKSVNAKEQDKKQQQDPDALKEYKSPIYRFLDLSKQVMQKTCPADYVKPDFFDLAVSVFINLQKKHFKFPDEATNYQGFHRIIDSLNACIEDATVFNFTTQSCPSDKPVTGTYCAFENCTMEMNIPGEFKNFDPIIETVWNILKNAHAYCFNHFNRTHFNDHHRFITWMIPLFENQINDIWRNGTAKGEVYGGAFGNQENVQTAVAYCTATSQMTTNYPWDLPRPDKIEELSKPVVQTRRKRATHNVQDHEIDISAECLSSHKVYQCE